MTGEDSVTYTADGVSTFCNTAVTVPSPAPMSSSRGREEEEEEEEEEAGMGYEEDNRIRSCWLENTNILPL